MAERAKRESDQRAYLKRLDEPVTVTLTRAEWMVVVGAARNYDSRVPRGQADGGGCLDKIEKAIFDA